MKILTTVKEVREYVKEARMQGKTVGLVPTMGYLHEGHGSLVKKSVEECDVTVVSIFVNPTQFAPNEDFDAYPRDLEHDVKLLTECGADVVFHPEASEMYFPDATTTIVPDVLSKNLCGKSRPIHFGGVCTVVGKLFNIVTPDKAFFGQKDAQQLAIIKRMVRDLNFGVEIVGCPIIREEDGLAKSSRNTYLNPDERQAALCLSQSVKLGKEMAQAGEKNTKVILDAMIAHIEKEPLAKIDYVQSVDAITMQDVEEITGETLFAMAVYIGKTRLIDNFIV
ncbi:MAG: pantoate--beta-alanine ligase [Clostridia bacterium]|nr:pantoate--beta-alanine ligase [Clostridia bacterium]